MSGTAIADNVLLFGRMLRAAGLPGLNFAPIGQRHIRFDTWEHFNDDIDAMRVSYLICN